jgi:hypothetical protein
VAAKRIDTVIRPAVAHGWLRRPELDDPHNDAWERPDGRIVVVKKGIDPQVISITDEVLRQFFGMVGSKGQ